MEAMKARAKSTVGKLLRSFMKTKEDWYAYVGRAFIVVQDGDEFKEYRTTIDHNAFKAYDFEDIPYTV